MKIPTNAVEINLINVIPYNMGIPIIPIAFFFKSVGYANMTEQ